MSRRQANLRFSVNATDLLLRLPLWVLGAYLLHLVLDDWGDVGLMLLALTAFSVKGVYRS